ncbi:conserved protein of unknown function [Citrobacter amalonaticus]|uniref:Uncharacterized protein n=1 Tax=Citrobacter amalonaticus TaxID=35703 RepID=A0AAX2BF10_CITAM|nr:conserved protein of unknown function [Citrobacter amalonaticus]SAZ14445.1 conserved protein of unknown function [Citrobacter amalonaticus]
MDSTQLCRLEKDPGILAIKKKIFLFRDLFYCDLLLGSPLAVDKADPCIKINTLVRIISCE